MSKNLKQALFEFGSDVYDYFTWQDTWWEHSKKLSEGATDPTEILDLGCGPGISAFALEEKHPEARITGVDLATRMIKKAQRTRSSLDSDCRFLRGDALQLPFRDQLFDLVTGHSFLYLLEDAESVLKEVHRVLEDGGRVSFLEPRKNPGLGWINEGIRGGVSFTITMIGWQIVSSMSGRFDRNSIRNLLKRAGYEDIKVEKTLGGLGVIVRGKKG